MRACARACAPTRASINHLLLIIKKISSFVVVVVVVIKSLLERFYMCVYFISKKKHSGINQINRVSTTFQYYFERSFTSDILVV